MKRQIVLIPLLAVALAGFARGQGTSEQEISAKDDAAKNFVQPGTQEVTLVISDDEVTSAKDKAAEKAALEVESQFIGSFGDRKLLDPILAPGFIFLAERWGQGYWQDKTQTLLVRTGPTPKEVNYKPDHRIVVHVFGNTVILTGVSYTILRYNGKLSKVTRQFMFVYGKQDDGRWLILSKCIADIPKGLTAPAPAMMLLGPDGQPPPVPAGDRFIYHKGSPVPELAPAGADGDSR
jgi:hypothetical protein